MKRETKKASLIYKKQNVLLHKAFSESGFPYAENKEVWLELMRETAKRRDGEPEIRGLSDLTLIERHKLIAHFQEKGMRIFAPSVPKMMWDWKKGDEDLEYSFTREQDSQVRMVWAMWTEAGYKPKGLRGLCFKEFGKSDPRFLNERQLNRLVNIVQNKVQTRGMGNYYRKRRPATKIGG